MLDFKDLEASALTKSLDKAFHIPNNFIDAGNGCVMPQKYRGISEQVRDFEIRADDVFMCSYPRTGSTWLQEMVWLLGNDLNYDVAKNTIQQIRNPLLELKALFSDDEGSSDWLKYGFKTKIKLKEVCKNCLLLFLGNH